MKKIKFLTIVFVMTLNVVLSFRQNKLLAHNKHFFESNVSIDSCRLKHQDTLVFYSVRDVFIKYNLK